MLYFVTKSIKLDVKMVILLDFQSLPCQKTPAVGKLA